MGRLCLIPAMFYIAVFAVSMWPSNIYGQPSNMLGVLCIVGIMISGKVYGPVSGSGSLRLPGGKYSQRMGDFAGICSAVRGPGHDQSGICGQGQALDVMAVILVSM